MTKTLENRFIIIIWWIIFVFILPWDQEKIVVINLVIFCYALYYMVSDSIESTNDQKKNLIRTVLTSSISKDISRLKTSVETTKENINTLNLVVIALLDSYVSSATVDTTSVNNKGASPVVFTNALFSALNFQLKATVSEVASLNLNKNVLATQLLLADSKSFFNLNSESN